MVVEYLTLFPLVLLSSPVFSLCPLPPMVADAVGNTGYDKDLKGYYIEYSCIQGHYISSGDSRLRCSNGTINGRLPMCTKKRCRSLSPGPRGLISNNRTEYGSVVSVKCEQGYKMSSTNSVELKLTCVDGSHKTGQWSSFMPNCSLITCSNCMTLAHCKSNCNSSLTYNYNSTVEYWCNSGYTASGNNILRCGDKGSWITDGSKMTCHASKTYIGCYSMENSKFTTTKLNDCRSQCQTNGYHFAGFNNAGCACANSLTYETNSCQERCKIDGKVACGGTGNNRTTHYSFYGCYVDPVIQTATVTFPPDSAKTCIEYCRLKKTRYALLLHSNQCSCTNLVSKTAKQVAISRCQYKNMTDYYFVRIIEFEKPYSSCNALYNAGIRFHGDYILGHNRQITKCNFKDGTPCDHGWIGYNGACYLFNPDSRTFKESLHYCVSLNSDLASIHDRNEINFIKMPIHVFEDLKHQSNWYIGLYDKFQLNNYIWSDGTLKVFNDFLIDYPSKENWPCVNLLYAGWKDVQCWQPAGLICKKKQDANQCLKLADPDSESKYSTQNPRMNPGFCFQICRGLKMTVSAVNNITCHCFPVMPSHNVLNWTECDHYCYPNSHQNCGGGHNVFFVTKEIGQPKAISCYELQLQDMTNRYTTDAAGDPLCSANDTNSCPSTWLSSQNSCYKLFESRTIYMDAVKQCIKNNGYIVSINDAEEESRLHGIIQKITVFKNVLQWWIGLTNVQNLGVFRWSDGQPVLYNKVYDNKYEYVAWTLNSNTWKTFNSHNAFICEKESGFIGCYNDTLQANPITESIDMTVNMCIELCRGRMKKYALLEMYRCYCSDNMTNKTSCNPQDICKAQPNQLCGKHPVFAVYQVDTYKKFANSCQDLLFEGISTPTVYVVGDKRKNCDFKGNANVCPSGTRPWIGFDGQCYLLLNETRSWFDAQKFCVSIGSTLASITDEQHLAFLAKVIKPRYSLTQKEIIWLGGSDEVFEGFYTWVDGNLLSKQQSTIIGTGRHHFLALKKPTYKLTKSTKKLGYTLCQISKDYQGCFQKLTVLPSTIKILVTSENLVSVNLCKQLCLGNDFTYSLTNQKSCGCTNHYSLLTQVDDKRCQKPCPSQSFLSCGSNDTWALHRLDTTKLATHCSQLSMNGIFLNATYKLWNSESNSSEMKRCGQADNSSCPVEWIGKDGICYYFSSKKTSLSEARKICFSKSAILSFPVNSVARTFIVDMLNSVPSIWKFVKFFVGVQTFNRGSYVVAATGKIIKPETDMPKSFKQLTLMWNNSYSESNPKGLEFFICEKFSGYKGCASLSSTQRRIGISTVEMTATQCLEFCRGQGYLTVALNITSCFCIQSDQVLNWNLNSESCSRACPGFDNQFCGGNNVYSVYVVDPKAPLVDSCNELANLGVTIPSTYKIQPNNQKAVLETTCFSTGNYAKSIQPNNYTFTSKQASFLTTDLRVHIFPTTNSAWKPTSVNGQWVEVALSGLYLVTGIRTRGVLKPDEMWVKSYELFYGDASPGYLAPYTENTDTEFQANFDGNTVVTRLFRKPFVANTIRLVVKQSHLSIALGFDFLGQPYPDAFASNNTIGCFADDNSTSLLLASISTKADCQMACLEKEYPIYGILERNGRSLCKCVLSFGKYGNLKNKECQNGSSVPSLFLHRTFEIGCQAPEPLNGAKITLQSNHVGGKYAYNSKAVYTCMPGTEFPDKSTSSIINCLQNNKWESVPGNCSRKRCPEIMKVDRTTIDTNETLFGSKVTYRCNSGFMFPNSIESFTIECLADGTWNANVPSCIGLKCRTPPPPTNSLLVAENGTHATFICNEGFYFVDGLTKKTFVCQQNITWAFKNDECKAPDPFQLQKTVSQGEQDKRISNPSHSFSARSLLDCISKCMQHISCSTISLYFQFTNKAVNCDLYIGTRSQITLIHAPGWNMYYLK